MPQNLLGKLNFKTRPPLKCVYLRHLPKAFCAEAELACSLVSPYSNNSLAVYLVLMRAGGLFFSFLESVMPITPVFSEGRLEMISLILN